MLLSAQLGKVARALREQRKIPQGVVARHLSKSQGCYCRMESGRAVWLVDDLQRFAALLETSPARLVELAQSVV